MLVAHHVGQQPGRTAKGNDLAPVTIAHPVDGCDGRLFGAREPVALTHAEGVIEGENDAAPRPGARDGVGANVGPGEGQSQQQDQQASQRKQQEVFQAAMLDGTLRPLFEKHKRTERGGSLPVLLQQVHEDGKADSGQTAQEPGSQKTHGYLLLWRMER